MKKLLNLLKNSLITYLALYGAKPQQVNAAFSSKNYALQSALDYLPNLNNGEALADFIRLTVENSNEFAIYDLDPTQQALHLQIKEDFSEKILFYIHKEFYKYCDKIIYKEFSHKNLQLSNFLAELHLDFLGLTDSMLDKIIWKLVDKFRYSSEEYDKILSDLFENDFFTKFMPDIEFKDLIVKLFAGLGFEKLQTLISLIPEDYYATHTPGLIVKNDYRYTVAFEDLILLREELSIAQQISLLQLLIAKNSSLFFQENVQTISSGLIYVYTMDQSLEIITFLKNQKIDNLALLSAAFVTLTTKFTDLSDKQKQYIIYELIHFYKTYDNIGTFLGAYRAFPLLEKIAAAEELSALNINLERIRENLISNAPFYIISNNTNDTNNFRKKRNFIFHGGVIENELLFNILKELSEFHNSLKVSLAAKEIPIAADFNPTYVHNLNRQSFGAKSSMHR
ncbi:hypothetical protein NOVO_08560 [Rickettsiales bacterium Ac37b]|nr:hypothetical protein NOVO_08560 [Rickettsiales bacterium Ac37b]